MLFQIITLSITGAMNTVLSEQHKHEMCRYLYNHQARHGIFPFLFYLLSHIIYVHPYIFYVLKTSFFYIVSEWRRRLGSTYWGTQHHVYVCLELCYSEAAWTRTWWWRRSYGERPRLDTQSWWSYTYHFLGKIVAISKRTFTSIRVISYECFCYLIHLYYFIWIKGAWSFWMVWK